MQGRNTSLYHIIGLTVYVKSYFIYKKVYYVVAHFANIKGKIVKIHKKIV